MNVELLNKVKEIILEEPRRFDMELFTAKPEDVGLKGKRRPPCGTVACIGGWAVIEHDHVPLDRAARMGGVQFRAQEVLELSDEEANRLFYDDHWPLDFKADYQETKNQTARARVAAQRIDHFIATNGAE